MRPVPDVANVQATDFKDKTLYRRKHNIPGMILLARTTRYSSSVLAKLWSGADGTGRRTVRQPPTLPRQLMAIRHPAATGQPLAVGQRTANRWTTTNADRTTDGYGTINVDMLSNGNRTVVHPLYPELLHYPDVRLTSRLQTGRVVVDYLEFSRIGGP